MSLRPFQKPIDPPYQPCLLSADLWARGLHHANLGVARRVGPRSIGFTEMGVRLLIAIPVHNEQKYVDRVLDQIRKFHAGDILVVDDGSTDQTPQLLANRSDIKVIRHPTNKGYGQSLIDAFDYAARRRHDWVITMDCDEQHEPERIPDFLREIESNRWDLISGSRYLLRRCRG